MTSLDRYLQECEETARFAQTLVGLPEEEALARAEEAGLFLEVPRPPFIVSADWRSQRIRARLDAEETWRRSRSAEAVAIDQQ